MHVKFRELWYDGTRIRGLKSVAYISLEYIFDNREMAEKEKLDIRKVSKYPENLTLVSKCYQIRSTCQIIVY